MMLQKAARETNGPLACLQTTGNKNLKSEQLQNTRTRLRDINPVLPRSHAIPRNRDRSFEV